MKTTKEIHDMIQTGRNDADYILNILEHVNDRISHIEARLSANEERIDRWYGKYLLVERVYNLINGSISVGGKRIFGQYAIDYLRNLQHSDLMSLWNDLEMLRPNNREQFNQAVKESLERNLKL